MKAIIKKIIDKGKSEGKFGTKFDYTIAYTTPDGVDRIAYYSSKKPNQTYFVEGKECEFNESEHTSAKGNVYFTAKPLYGDAKSGYGKKLQQEQARYSGFAVSYVKDMIVAGKVDPDQWHPKSKEVFQWMVEMDNTLKS